MPTVCREDVLRRNQSGRERLRAARAGVQFLFYRKGGEAGMCPRESVVGYEPPSKRDQAHGGHL